MLRNGTIAAAVVILLGGAGGSETAMAQGFGISAGGNFAELSDIDSGDRQASFDNATGWHLHVWFDLPVGPVAVRPGLRYMDMGELFEDARVGGLDDPIDEEAINLLEIPVDVRLRMALPLIAPYVMAGPVLRFPTGGDSERFRSFSLAGGAGVGLEVGAGGLRLYPELKYTFGITRFTEESYELGGVTISPDEDQTMNAIMLSIGIGL